jgi:hypothetical protein
MNQDDKTFDSSPHDACGCDTLQIDTHRSAVDEIAADYRERGYKVTVKDGQIFACEVVTPKPWNRDVLRSGRERPGE